MISPNKNIIIVLYHPQNEGNIGAVARAMMNMGVSTLRLVLPEADPLSRIARDRAVHARPILQQAKLYKTLEEATSDCHQIIGTSGKSKDSRVLVHTPKEFALLLKKIPDKKVALVFGPEDKGLGKKELLLCDAAIEIPSSDKFPSLNLSHAVIIILYEIFAMDVKPQKPTKTQATLKKREAFYKHLREALISINFLKAQNPDHIMRDLRNIFSRSNLTERDVTILRGMCGKILKGRKCG